MFHEIVFVVIANIFFSVSFLAWPIEDALNNYYVVVPDKQLSSDVTPSGYNLTLKPYLRPEDGENMFHFDAEVYINITAHTASVSEVIMHSQRLTYTLSEYWEIEKPSNVMEFQKTTLDPLINTLNLKLKNKLDLGKNYTFHFGIRGSMDTDMVGFYRSSYVDPNNNTKWLGSTQFQKNFARRMFPCFDEPKFKATFDIAIIRHKSFKTLSNTRILSTKKIDENTYIDIYDRTVRMSTYLVAVVVSGFNERTNGDFSIAARPEYFEQTSYAFDIGQLILDEFDKYFELPYYSLGIDKMHMVAIPDFSSGAMENWGLVTYRERGLLFQERSSTQSVKQSITVTIAHEQAHMWFGNLVTCEWWTYTWLNEGFATYFGYMMTAKVHPRWEVDKQFVVDQMQTVLRIDSTNQTRPMSSTSMHEMHTRITYNKAASVIRMVQHAMGEKAFRKSLQNYLKEQKYKNAVPENLFKHWESNWPTDSRKYAQALFESFTTQVGYPVITFNVTGDYKTMEISQKRFLSSPSDGSNNSLLYTLPVTYTTNLDLNFSSTSPTIYLEAATTTKTKINLTPGVKWVIANIQQTGFYRVNYNIDNWHMIHHTLMTPNWGGIHELNRAQFVDDLFNLAQADFITYSLAFSCLKYLEKEVNYLAWTAAFSGYSHLAIRLGTSENKNFARYILHQTQTVFNHLGFDQKVNDTTLEVYNRNNVLTWCCKYGNPECISQALALFGAMKTNPVPANIRSAVYCTAMREGNEQSFSDLFVKYKTDTVPTEQTLIINSLGCVKDPKLVEKYFHIIVSDDIRRQDKSAALTSLHTSNAENISPLFKLVTDNCDVLAKSMGSYDSAASVIVDISEKFTTEAQLKTLEDFLASNREKFGSSAAALENSIQRVKANLAWSTHHLGDIIEYLNAANSIPASAFTFDYSYSYILFAAILCLLNLFR